MVPTSDTVSKSGGRPRSDYLIADGLWAALDDHACAKTAKTRWLLIRSEVLSVLAVLSARIRLPINRRRRATG